MKERPILFSAPMVRAILDGRKTQTRRIVKQVPHWEHFGRDIMEWGLSGCYTDGDGRHWLDVQTDVDDNTHEEIQCPYGRPGDRLWVRETWGCGWHDGAGGYSALRPSGPQYDRPDKVFYKADFPDDDEKNGKRCWRSSIFMPRWAARITLEIVAVRVERVHDISQADAISEGAPESHSSIDRVSMEFGFPDFSRSYFAQLWQHLNGAASWEANPWVWVIEFRNVKGGAT